MISVTFDHLALAEKKARYIHHINHLWHLALDFYGPQSPLSIHLRKRKNRLQNSFAKKFADIVYLEETLEIPQNERGLYNEEEIIVGINIRGSSIDACHIPRKYLSS